MERIFLVPFFFQRKTDLIRTLFSLSVNQLLVWFIKYKNKDTNSLNLMSRLQISPVKDISSSCRQIKKEGTNS